MNKWIQIIFLFLFLQACSQKNRTQNKSLLYFFPKSEQELDAFGFERISNSIANFKKSQNDTSVLIYFLNKNKYYKIVQFHINHPLSDSADRRIRQDFKKGVISNDTSRLEYLYQFLSSIDSSFNKEKKVFSLPIGQESIQYKIYLDKYFRTLELWYIEGNSFFDESFTTPETQPVSNK